MKIEITGASYSTTLTYELVTDYGFQILSAPAFPSLWEKAFYTIDGTKPTIPLFIQYKMGDYFIGNTAALKEFWGVPYYRFLIHPRNKNKFHQLLLNLEEMNQLVYYTAPEFHTMSEFYKNVRHRSLLEKSTFWSPQSIGAFSDDERYFLSYKRDMNFGILQPGKIKIEGLTNGEMLLSAIRHKFETNQAYLYDEVSLLDFGDALLDNYLKVFYTQKQRNLIGDIRQGREHLDPRDYLSLISMLLYDCYVYMITM